MQLTRRDAIKGALISAVAGLLGLVRTTKAAPEPQPDGLVGAFHDQNWLANQQLEARWTTDYPDDESGC